jgi:hypothetical protein
MSKKDGQQNSSNTNNNSNANSEKRKTEAGDPKSKSKWSPYALFIPVNDMLNVSLDRAPTYAKSKDQNNDFLKDHFIALPNGWWGVFLHRGKDNIIYNDCHRYVFSKFIKVFNQTIIMADNNDIAISNLTAAFNIFNMMLKGVPFFMKARKNDSIVLLSSSVIRNYETFLDRTLANSILEQVKEIKSEASNISMIKQFGLLPFIKRTLDEYLYHSTDEKYVSIGITLCAIGAPFLNQFLEENKLYYRDVDLEFIKDLNEKANVQPFTVGFDKVLPLLTNGVDKGGENDNPSQL